MLIRDNAYLILWLDTSADEKTINKRYKDLQKFLDIKEIPNYENDLSFIDYWKIRIIENINEAFYWLTNDKKKIYQVFFRFQIIDEDDKKLFNDLQKWNIDSVIIWRKLLFYETWKYHYLKNAAIAWLLLFENRNKIESKDTYVDITINGLHECMQSESFWNEFVKILNLYADLHVSNETLEDFKSELPQYIAESLFNEDEQDKSLYIAYNSKSKKSAKNFDNNKEIAELFNKVNDYKTSISKLNLKSNYDEIIVLVKKIKKELNKLNEWWLQNNSTFIRQRDDIARNLRNLAIDFHNQLDYYQTSIDILINACEIAASNEIINKIKDDIEIVKSNAFYAWIFISDENQKKQEPEEKSSWSYRISKPNIKENININKTTKDDSKWGYRISKPLDKESISFERNNNNEREEIINVINMIKDLIKNWKKDEALLLISATIWDPLLKNNEIVRLKARREKITDEKKKEEKKIDNNTSKKWGLETRKHWALKDIIITIFIVWILIFLLYIWTK